MLEWNARLLTVFMLFAGLWDRIGLTYNWNW